ncbi:MAG: hypothetical protein LBU87_04430 [Lactobacillales bacterium]|jgi:hypothetical protein|nr:hypothetical protein [Lactobacillales bacterium]
MIKDELVKIQLKSAHTTLLNEARVNGDLKTETLLMKNDDPLSFALMFEPKIFKNMLKGKGIALEEGKTFLTTFIINEESHPISYYHYAKKESTSGERAHHYKRIAELMGKQLKKQGFYDNETVEELGKIPIKTAFGTSR